MTGETIKQLYKLKKEKWLTSSELEDFLRSNAEGRRLYPVIPPIEGECRFKVVDDQEYGYLLHHQVEYQIQRMDLDAVHTERKPLPLGLRPNCNVSYLFGYEPRDLNHKRCKGVMLSYWTVDPLVTDLRVNYGFSSTVNGVYGVGFGPRLRAGHFGSCSYFSKRYTKRCHPKPFVAEEEIGHQEYRNDKQGMDLLASYTKKKIHELRNNVNKIAKDCNPHCMMLQAPYQIKGIATGGRRPKPTSIPDSSQLTAGLYNNIENLPVNWSTNPTYGFACEWHVDTEDRPSKKKLKNWKALAKEKEWSYVSKFMDTPYFSLATTCGYQFTFKTEEDRQNFNVNAYFTMDGLGIAVPIVDGIAHHFYAAKFSHRTCLPLCRRKTDGKVSAFNIDDNFMIFAWGSTDNSRQVDASDEEAGADAGDGGHAGGGGGGAGGGVVDGNDGPAVGFYPPWLAGVYAEMDAEAENQVPVQHEVIPPEEDGPNVL